MKSLILHKLKLLTLLTTLLAAQGTTADNALPKTGGAMTGAITTNSTFDGRDVATDGAKLDGIEASADVTDTANVTAAGALMDSELTSIASVKALNQGVATTDSPTFAGATVNGTVEFDGLSGTGAVTVTDILDQDNMSSNSATALATQQSIKAYVDSQVATSDTLAEVLANGNATGGTDINFGDEDKALFGAGNNLKIYHASNNQSYIHEVGSGDLNILATNLKLQDAGGSTKVLVNSTGIDVTGTLVSDGLTVDGQGKIQGAFALLDLVETDITDKNTRVITSGGQFRVDTVNDALSSSTKRIMVDHATGDISFYEDTGTTAKLFWDAADEALGIGTSSPSTPLAVHNALSSGQAIAEFRSTGNSNSTIDLRADGTGDPQILFDLNGAVVPVSS